MQVFTDLLMKSSALILNDDQDFPSNPRIGQFCFKEGILYIYATIQGISTWYPLTNKSLYYVHIQGLSALNWTINHGLKTSNLIIMVYDNNNVVQLATDLDFVDDNTLIIGFTEVTKGKAVIFAATDEYGASGAMSGVFTVDSEINQLALSIHPGALIVAIRSDLNETYIYNGGVTGTLSDWSKILFPESTNLPQNSQDILQGIDITNIDYNTDGNPETVTYANGWEIDITYDNGSVKFVSYYDQAATLVEKWQYNSDVNGNLQSTAKLI